MFGFDDHRDAHEQVYGDFGDQRPKVSHELLAGGAAFEGMKLFEDHQRREGKPVSHAFAKEALAGFVGGEVNKKCQEHKIENQDQQMAQEMAQQHAMNMYDNHYGGYDGYDPNMQQGPDFSYRQRGGDFGYQQQQDFGGYQQRQDFGGYQQQQDFGGYQQQQDYGRQW